MIISFLVSLLEKGVAYINYKYPRLTSAHGFLLSISIDTVKSKIESNKGITWNEIIKKYKIGDIHIDLGGSLSYPKIYTDKKP